MILRPVLLIEDDPTLRDMLVDALMREKEFSVTAVGSMAEAETLLERLETRFDCVLLDIGLPDGNGRDLCRNMRRCGHGMPIIMLTGWTDDEDVVVGLESGANDYVVKPFKISVLIARMRAQLRIFDVSEDAVFTIGRYTFRPGLKLLADGKKRIRLTEKEAGILRFLYRHIGHPVARTKLLNEVWGYNATVTTHTLETHIYRLRQKIEADPSNATLLITEGGGYRLDPANAQAMRPMREPVYT
jgi:DNA-binding response OmpR family regulator